MNEPTRFLDDADAPEEVRLLLRAAAPPSKLPHRVRLASEAHVSALARADAPFLTPGSALVVGFALALVVGLAFAFSQERGPVEQTIVPLGLEEGAPEPEAPGDGQSVAAPEPEVVAPAAHDPRRDLRTDDVTARDARPSERRRAATNPPPSPSALDRVAQSPAPPASSPRAALTPAQLREVVSANRRSLQRCYERSLGGGGAPPVSRYELSLVIDASGRVKDARVRPVEPVAMSRCFEAAVRRWRFPPSATGQTFSFPVAFSAGG